MRNMTASELKNAIKGSILSGNGEEIVVNAVIDSRLAGPGDVFFALKGEKNDGHDFLGQVFDSGCRMAVVSDEEKAMIHAEREGVTLIKVGNTLDALQTLGRYYLDTLDLKAKIGVTGSVGKTSTRDFLYYVLSGKYRTARSIKNYNSETGLPLSIVSFPGDTEAAVIEMGMDFKGSIAVLADIAEPDIGVITNVGISHLENFPEEGREGILSTKLEITKNFNEDSVLIINDDNDMLATVDMKERNIPGKLVRVGTGERCDFLVSNVKDKGIEGISFDISYNGETVSVELPVPGAHNAINAGLAMAAGCLKGMTLEETAAGFSKAELTANRLNVIKKDGITVIDDTYNAAPDSMKGAIDTLMSTPVPEGGRRIAILGDMGELGFESNRGHGEVGAYAHRKGVDVTLTVGPNSYAAYKGWGNDAAQEGHELRLIPTGPGMPLIETDEQTGKACEYFENKEMIIAGILEHIHEGDCILVKASRLMALEKIVEHIVNDK